MKLGTTNLRGHRNLPNLIDITVKSAMTPEGLALAPTWEMVGGLKRWQAEQDMMAGRTVDLDGWFQKHPPLSWEDYTTQYLNLLRKRYSVTPGPFLLLIARHTAILGCYCPDHTCCHRTLAADAIMRLAEAKGVEVTFIGEVK